MSKYLSPKSNKKSITMMVSLILILTIGVGGTLAYLITSTQEVKNTFTPAKNEIKIEEDFDGGVKKNIGVTNKSDFPVFVRVQFVETWMKDGKVVVAPDGAEVVYPTSIGGWVKHTDGFWYYTKPVEAGEIKYLYGDTGITVTKPAAVTAELNLEVLAQSVQAEPIEAVQELWGVNPTNLVNKEG